MWIKKVLRVGWDSKRNFAEANKWIRFRKCIGISRVRGEQLNFHPFTVSSIN